MTPTTSALRTRGLLLHMDGDVNGARHQAIQNGLGAGSLGSWFLDPR